VAASRLLYIEPGKSATAIKVNPDSPQRPLRAEALRRGITVFIPTPRLKDVRHLADHIIAERGVRHGRLVTIPVALENQTHSHGREFQHRHLHAHVREAYCLMSRHAHAS
jgi:5-formyltetrahydrofolate cyclo-ligase